LKAVVPSLSDPPFFGGRPLRVPAAAAELSAAISSSGSPGPVC